MNASSSHSIGSWTTATTAAAVMAFCGIVTACDRSSASYADYSTRIRKVGLQPLDQAALTDVRAHVCASEPVPGEWLAALKAASLSPAVAEQGYLVMFTYCWKLDRETEYMLDVAHTFGGSAVATLQTGGDR